MMRRLLTGLVMMLFLGGCGASPKAQQSSPPVGTQGSSPATRSSKLKQSGNVPVPRHGAAGTSNGQGTNPGVNSKNTSTSSQETSPKRSSSSYNAFFPTAVEFWNEQNGLVSGQKGSSHVVLRTSDGGKTWQTLMHQAGEFDALGNIVWLVTAKTHTLLRAQVGPHLNWETVNSHVPVAAVDFTNKQHGWGVGPAFSGKMYTTEDGGKSWTLVSSPCHPNNIGDFSTISKSSAMVLCVTQPGAGNQGKVLKRTNDGGKDWTTVLTVPFGARNTIGGLSSLGYASGIVFNNSQDGWLWESRGSLYRTTDGGRQWKAQSITKPDARETRSLSFVSSSLAYMVLWNPGAGDYQLMATNDGGATWKKVYGWPMPK